MGRLNDTCPFVGFVSSTQTWQHDQTEWFSTGLEQLPRELDKTRFIGTNDKIVTVSL